MFAGASRVRCLVVDDHEVLRSGVVRVLEREDDMEIVGSTGDPGCVAALVERRRPHVAIVDLVMPSIDGVELCERLLAAHPELRVIVYTGVIDAGRVQDALEAGATGFVLKTSPSSDLVRAVRLVLEGRTYVDGVLASELVGARDSGAPRLSPRELEVLQLLAEGLTTDKAAARLFLSPATVRSYAEGATQKLEGRNRAHTIAQALRHELIR